MLYLKFHQLHVITFPMLQKLGRDNMSSIIYNTTKLSSSRAPISHQALGHALPDFLTSKRCFLQQKETVYGQTKMNIT